MDLFLKKAKLSPNTAHRHNTPTILTIVSGKVTILKTWRPEMTKTIIMIMRQTLLKVLKLLLFPMAEKNLIYIYKDIDFVKNG